MERNLLSLPHPSPIPMLTGTKQTLFYFLIHSLSSPKRRGWGERATQPPTVACKMEAQLEYVHNAYTLLHVWHRFVCSVGAYWQKFLRRSSLGSLLRVRCWLGTQGMKHLKRLRVGGKESLKDFGGEGFPPPPPSSTSSCATPPSPFFYTLKKEKNKVIKNSARFTNFFFGSERNWDAWKK